MPEKGWKDNISFILIEPKEPGNIGAAVRAMKNMGFHNLELVNPCEYVTGKDRYMACGAVDILKRARVHKTFNEAIREKKLIIGTTRRIGRRRGLILPLPESTKKIITAAQNNNIAVLFGREKNGLKNREIEKCGLLVTIPSDPAAPSLNLAQSVMLVAYELRKQSSKKAFPELVKKEQLTVLYKRIQETLTVLGYIPRGDRDLGEKIMRNIRYLVGRSGLTEWELNMLYGICAQIEKKTEEHH
jgi:TrmH family RNA methyltransferase